MVTGKNSLSMGLLPRPGHSRIKGNFLDTKTVLPLGYEVPLVGIDHDKCATNPPPQDLDIVRLRRQGAVKSLTVVCLFQISLLPWFLNFFFLSLFISSAASFLPFFIPSFLRFFTPQNFLWLFLDCTALFPSSFLFASCISSYPRFPPGLFTCFYHWNLISVFWSS